MKEYYAGQITRLCAGGQFIGTLDITGKTITQEAHKTKATPKDRQCGNTKPIQDNHKSAITATCADEEKALILTICNQYVGCTAWRTSIAVFVHISAISRMRHAARNGAVFFDGVGLAPTHTSTDEAPRRPLMVSLVGERSRSLANLLAGLPIPARDTTSKISLFGGGNIKPTTENAAMLATIPTQNPLFVWRFFSDQNATYHTVTATSERKARLQLPAVRLVFVARIRVEGVNHA
ncbi:host cell division inhibitor Icd-like protein [Salmonella enterica]|nr:host cell division inhibitor Icd-like protein [Salmonella enterica]